MPFIWNQPLILFPLIHTKNRYCFNFSIIVLTRLTSAVFVWRLGHQFLDQRVSQGSQQNHRSDVFICNRNKWSYLTYKYRYLFSEKMQCYIKQRTIKMSCSSTYSFLFFIQKLVSLKLHMRYSKISDLFVTVWNLWCKSKLTFHSLHFCVLVECQICKIK